LEAVSVAHVAVISLEKNIEYESCKLVEETAFNSIVQCAGKRSYTVHLRRLFKKDGIWTAQEIEEGN
jgi:hypothetical protein